MHDCPNCGQACYCSGDIDDCPVYLEPFLDCQCDCEGFDDAEDYFDNDQYYPADYPSDPDDWAFVALNQWVLEGYVKQLAGEDGPPAPPAGDKRSQSAES